MRRQSWLAAADDARVALVDAEGKVNGLHFL